MAIVRHGLGVKLALLLSLLFGCSSMVLAQEAYPEYPVYSLDVDLYRNGSAYLNDIHSEIYYSSDISLLESEYHLLIYDFGNSTIFRENIPVSFEGEIFGESSSGHIERKFYLNKTTISIQIPVYQNTTRLSITHEDKEMLGIDLRDYFCNKNNVCDLGENHYICPEDCLKYPENVPTQDIFSRPNNYFFVFLAILAIILLVAVYRKINTHK
jgi:hypothetical protein